MTQPRGSSPEAVSAFAGAMLMLAGHVAAKATRDALFLSHFAATELPRAMVAAGAVSLLSAVLMGRLLTRVGPGRLLPAAFGLSASLFVGEWLLFSAQPALVSVLVYIHQAVFGAALISGFWSVVNERFDPHTAKPIAARIAVFAALGGVVGGLTAERLSGVVSVPTMLPLVGALQVACAIATRGVGVAEASSLVRRIDGPTTASGLRVLRESPFLTRMAGLVALCAIVDSLLDYALKSEAASRFQSGESLIQFFAIFYTAAGLLAFVLQASLGSRVLRSLGLGGAMALLPGAVALTGLMATAVTRLWTVVVVRAAEFAVSNSVFRVGFELLYTPLAPGVKRPTKPYIDVGSRRLGDMAGGGLILGLLFLLPSVSTSLIVGLAVVATLVVLLLVVQLHRGYVRQLASSLRSGLVSLDETDALDGTTARTLSESQVAIDREELLARIRELQHEQREPAPATEGVADRPGRDTASPDLEPGVEHRELFARISDLSSDDPERIRDALRAVPEEPRWVPHVLPLLERFDVLEEVLGFLRWAAPRCIGQLGDALLDPDQPVLVRRRIPRALESCVNPRALDALHLGLGAPDFEIRFQCARAGARLIARSRTLRLMESAVYAIVQRELEVSPQTWEHQGRRRAEDPEESVLLEASDYLRVNRSVEHVFTVMSLSLNPNLMGSALRGLYSPDDNLRGTALEYLDATLPEPVRRALWPRIGRTPQPRPSLRPRQEIADDLRASLEQIEDILADLQAAPGSVAAREESGG